MNYKLVEANNNDIDKLFKYKLNTIFEYATNLSKEENRIKDYVETNIPLQLKDYKMINIDNKVVGYLLIQNKDDGILLDEIYIEEEYRNKGVGSNIIKNILSNNNTVYLWVYKLNTRAIFLYKKLGFIIVDETETRNYMKYELKNNTK